MKLDKINTFLPLELKYVFSLTKAFSRFAADLQMLPIFLSKFKRLSILIPIIQMIFISYIILKHLFFGIMRQQTQVHSPSNSHCIFNTKHLETNLLHLLHKVLTFTLIATLSSTAKVPTTCINRQ